MEIDIEIGISKKDYRTMLKKDKAILLYILSNQKLHDQILKYRKQLELPINGVQDGTGMDSSEYLKYLESANQKFQTEGFYTQYLTESLVNASELAKMFALPNTWVVPLADLIRHNKITSPQPYMFDPLNLYKKEIGYRLIIKEVTNLSNLKSWIDKIWPNIISMDEAIFDEENDKNPSKDLKYVPYLDNLIRMAKIIKWRNYLDTVKKRYTFEYIASILYPENTHIEIATKRAQIEYKRGMDILRQAGLIKK